MQWFPFVLLFALGVHGEFSQHLRVSRIPQSPSERQLMLTMRDIISKTLGDREEQRRMKQEEVMRQRIQSERDNPEFADTHAPSSMCTIVDRTPDNSHVFMQRASGISQAFRNTLRYPILEKRSVLLCTLPSPTSTQGWVTVQPKEKELVVRASGGGSDGDGDYNDMAVPLAITIFIVAIPTLSVLMILVMMVISCYFSKTGGRIRHAFLNAMDDASHGPTPSNM